MNLADQITTLAAEDAELAQDVTQLADVIGAQTTKLADMQTQIDALTAAGVSPEQTAAIQAVLDDMKATHEKAVALIPAPVATGTGTANPAPADGAPAEPTNATLPDQAPA